MSEALVSVVIPCRNEVRHIENCIRSILKSDHKNLEVIVVDGMSEDGTREVLGRLSAEFPQVRSVDNPKKLTPYAFNIGVRAACGDYIQIVGSRNTLGPRYISILVQALEADPRLGCVGGDYQHVFDSKIGRYLSLAMESPFGVGGSNYRAQKKNCFVDTVGVPLYRRDIFKRLGEFDESLTRNQDDEFNFRVRQAGYLIQYVHEAKNTYLVRSDLKKAFWQFFQYGYFKVFVSLKHRQATTLRQLVPFCFVLYLLSAVLIPIVPYYGGVWLIVALIYLALGFGVTHGRGLSLWERGAVQWVIFVLHMGYGLGYLRGVWDFAILNRKPSLQLQQQTT